MKSLYKLAFICILTITAISAGQFALYRIHEQHEEIRFQYQYKDRAEELESLFDYQQEQALPDLRVYDRISPQQKEMINRIEKQTYYE